ncbi:hypothetical protein EXE46_05380 [Halorubrum sp. GN11_10-6_MGM]|uniref:hypothetical protein n=1 Tax=Halorubrum sp. GN11_10-6_MGM TaxID=2518112 RepID=UPI0010F7D624|nr:hypothetical protein [Halorubrum sp. GN11_10-6_MGM]TKX75055.1 hypothetical protein EXE46_05380 [Halorubrum sp. GN11_10-6_MGM]
MSLALQFGTALGLLVAALPTYWVAARLALRTSAPTVWLRRLLVSLLPVAGVAYLLFGLAGVGSTARRALAAPLLGSSPPAVTSVAGDLAAQFALFLSAGCVTLAAYAVTVPAIREARDVELSTATAVRRVARFALVLAVMLTAVFVPFERLVRGEDLAAAPVAVVLLVAVFSVATPVLIRVARSHRAPTAAERERLESLGERVGLAAADVRVLTDADETIEIRLRGLPMRRTLYVSTFALRRLDDDALGALLAVNVGIVAHHYRAVKRGPLFGLVVLGTAALASDSTLAIGAVLALALAGWLPTLWLARRAIRRADDHAAERLGPGAVADALERVAAEQNLDVPTGGPGTVLKSRPPLGERIDRLRDRSD